MNNEDFGAGKIIFLDNPSRAILITRKGIIGRRLAIFTCFLPAATLTIDYFHNIHSFNTIALTTGVAFIPALIGLFLFFFDIKHVEENKHSLLRTPVLAVLEENRNTFTYLHIEKPPIGQYIVKIQETSIIIMSEKAKLLPSHL